MSEVKTGNNVSVHYTGKFDDGTVFDSSHNRGQALTFTVGSGQMIAGFDNALVGMTVGETKTTVLEPADAYGDHNPEAIQTTPRSVFPEGLELKLNEVVRGKDEAGQIITARVHELNKESVVLDFNHPLAGKKLTFEIELVSVD